MKNKTDNWREKTKKIIQIVLDHQYRSDTTCFELINQEIATIHQDGYARGLKMSSPGRKMYLLGIKDGRELETIKINRPFEALVRKSEIHAELLEKAESEAETKGYARGRVKCLEQQGKELEAEMEKLAPTIYRIMAGCPANSLAREEAKELYEKLSQIK